MKCISIRQSWAGWIVLGAKDVENRTWDTRYRGPLLIHASKVPDLTRVEDLPPACERLVHMASSRAGTSATMRAFTLGAIIGKIDLVGVVTGAGGNPWFEGPYGLVLSNAILFPKPIPYRGQLGIFDVPDRVVAHAF